MANMSIQNLVYLNGSFIPIEDARISVLDRGFIFGDGVYEVVPYWIEDSFLVMASTKWYLCTLVDFFA
jgi:hypothetical protein